MPTVSIVILNWNGKKFTSKCLDSLQKIRNKSFEIIVVDNNSSDGSSEFIKKNYPKVKVVENEQNYGFAKGNNIGIKKAKGKYILVLNNDTIVTPNFLDAMLTDFQKDKMIGCVQPQIRLMDAKKTLDGVGAFLTPTGFLYHFGYLKNSNQRKYKLKMHIFSAKGACMLLSKKALDKIGLFDEDFFIFFEETDLCFRLWLAGFTVLYEPDSIIYHHGGGDTMASNNYQYERRTYLSFRNMICSYIKNFGTSNLLTILPIFLLLLLGTAFYFFSRGRFRLFEMILKAFWWNIINLSKSLKKRSFVQKKLRKLSDFSLNGFVMRAPGFDYYKMLLFGKLKAYKETI